VWSVTYKKISYDKVVSKTSRKTKRKRGEKRGGYSHDAPSPPPEGKKKGGGMTPHLFRSSVAGIRQGIPKKKVGVRKGGIFVPQERGP